MPTTTKKKETSLSVVDGDLSTGTNGNSMPEGPEKGTHDLEAEIRTGKRVCPLPNGEVCILRLPTQDQLDAANLQADIALFSYMKKGLPSMRHVVEQMKEVLDWDKALTLYADKTKHWVERIQDVQDLLQDSGLSDMIGRTAEARAGDDRLRWFIVHCIETEDGRNWWEASEWKSFGNVPQHYGPQIQHMLGELLRFMGEARDPKSVTGSSSGEDTGDSSGDSANSSRADPPDPGTPSSVN